MNTLSNKNTKSSRHSKIAGDFGEMIVLYYLSRYGFECARIDHTGIDLLARLKTEAAPRGISVKTASRVETRISKPCRIPVTALDDATQACNAFSAIPYIAVVFDGIERMCILLQSVEDIRKQYLETKTKTLAIGFQEQDRARYKDTSFKGLFIDFSVSLDAWNKDVPQIKLITKSGCY